MLEKLRNSLEESPIVKKDDYDYFVNPITDGIPIVEPDLLREVADTISNYVDMNIDKIVCVEAMGIHIATALSLKTGKPFVVVRKRSYDLEFEIAVHQVTGYSECELYINGVEKCDRILLVDDVVSTGGTMIAVLGALKRLGAKIVDVLAVIEKGDGKKRVEEETGLLVKTLVKVDVEDDRVVIKKLADGNVFKKIRPNFNG